jgi:UPF0755 protein
VTTLYDDETVVIDTMPPSRGGWPRWLKVMLAVVVAGLLVLGAAGFWAVRQVNGTGGGAEVAVEVPMGSSSARIAAILDDKGVIENASLFRLYLRVTGAGAFQAGAYTFRKGQGYDDVVKVLERGPELDFDRLTIPEGFTLAQIAARVGRLPGRSAERFLDIARSGEVRSRYQPAGSTNLEGLLLPETYDFDPDDDERAILARMVQSFDAAAAELGLDQAQAKIGLSPYEAVIVASMVEEEAKLEDERPKVATVILNRLEKGWALGIDATIRYALNRPTEPLRKSDLAKDNPYNTRLRKGLIPTPIAAPSRSALRATLAPQPGPWMYYVLIDKSGRHAFAVTDAEFNRYKAEAREKGLL